MADEIGPALTRLLTDPPSGFVALRGEKTSATWPMWKAKPFVPGAACELRGDETGPQLELRCTVNERSDAATTKAWYAATADAIAAALPRVPNGRSFVRKPESASEADSYRGVTTVWSYDGRSERIEIELGDASSAGNARNTLSVRYLKR